MEPMIEIARRLRFLWALALILLTVVFLIAIALDLPDVAGVRWVFAVLWPTLAWWPLYTSWRMPVRLALAAPGVGMLLMTSHYAFTPTDKFINYLPQVLLVSAAAGVAILLVSFLLSPLFRRA